MESSIKAALPVRDTKDCLSNWVVSNKELILPLLGNGKIRDKLDEAPSIQQDNKSYQILSTPSGIRAHLKPHQLEGLSFLSYLRENNAHGILGDEMGLGKTLQVLSFFQHLVNIDPYDRRPFLVVCPLSVLSTWISETKKWTSLLALQYYGSQEKRKELAKVIAKKEIDVVVTTYETLVCDLRRLNSLGKWKATVLDEGHKIRNDGKKSSASVSRLKSDQRIILTGTPIHNDLVETWSIIKWLYPAIFSGKETSALFKEAFSLGDGKVDTEFIDHVRKFLDVIMIRRTKEADMNLNLPPKKEVVLYAPLTELQRSLYLDVVYGKGLTPLSGGFGTTPPSTPTSVSTFDKETQSSLRPALNPLMELRKVCSHPMLLESFQDIDLDVITTSSKFIILEKLLQQVVFKERKKVLIFSGFDGALDCSEELLERLEIQFLRLDGSTSAAVRKYNIHLFSKDSKFKVFLVATKAGGEGVTLTAAEVVVFLDLDWNPQVIRQAEARAHRIGQTRPVTVYKLCTRGTVEEQMIGRLNKKLYLDAKVNNQSVSYMSPLHADLNEWNRTDTEVIRDIIRTSIKPVAVEQMNADRMLHWDWDDIVHYCTANTHEMPQTPTTPTSPQQTFDEKVWLAKSERIKTDFFHGVRIPRSRAAPPKEFRIETMGKRIIKSRVIFNRKYGCHVSKESMLCAEGEAVPTMAGKNPSLADFKAPPRRTFGHEKSCMFCRKARGLTVCSYCPRAYHEKCAGKKKTGKMANNSCPYHKCAECLQSAPEAGGLLFNCYMCPRAFCVECVNLDTMQSLSDELAEFQALGFDQPKHMKHIVCGDCLDKARGLKRSVSDDRAASGKRIRMDNY